MPVAEDVKANNCTLDCKKIDVGYPLFTEEYLWRVNITVKSQPQEEKEDSNVHPVVTQGSKVMKYTILTIFIIDHVFEVHRRLSIRVGLYSFTIASTDSLYHRLLEFVFTILRGLSHLF